MKGIIYYIRSAATNRVYVGSTTRGTRQRWLEHMHYLRKNTHHSKHMQRVYNKYGESDLSIECAKECGEDENLLAVEQSHIDKHKDSCMNGIPVSDSIYAAHAANRGRVMSEEERAKRSSSAKLAILEGRAKRGPWSDERKKAHGIRLTGRKMPRVTAETCANISAGLKLNHALKGTAAKEKQSNPRTSFIESSIGAWLELRKAGKSFREIERITGRCRSVIARECKKALSND